MVKQPSCKSMLFFIRKARSFSAPFPEFMKIPEDRNVKGKAQFKKLSSLLIKYSS